MANRSLGGPARAVRVAALALGLGAVAPLAGAAPQIRVASPAPSTAIYNMLPGISVEYSSDDPQKALNLESLSVTVVLQGRQWPGSLSAGSTSATFTLGAPLVAGDLTIAASIADVSGTTATASQSYSVFPTFQAISPNRGYPGDTVLLSVVGLDTSGSNVATFPSLYDPAGVSAPIALGDSVTVVVPDDKVTSGPATSGPVYVSVNGKWAREKYNFTVPPPYPDCGVAEKMIGLPDGSLLIKHRTYFNGPSECPDVPGATYQSSDYRPVVTLAYPDRHLLVRTWNGPGAGEAVADIAVDKAAKRVAVLTSQPTGTGGRYLRVYLYDLEQLRNGIRSPLAVTRVFWGSQYDQMADFDSEGNLYVATADYGLPDRQGLKLNRLAKASIETGGDATYEVAMQFPSDYGIDFRLSSDGIGYIAGYVTDVNERDTVFVVDLRGPAPGIVGQFSAPDDNAWGYGGITALAVTCRSNEVWGASIVLLDEGTYWYAATRVWRWDSKVGGEPQTMDIMPWTYWGQLAISPSGRFLLYRDGSGVVPSRASVVPCADDPIQISASTTRWRPQRDPGTDPTSQQPAPIKFDFTSSTPLASATVTLTGPSAVAPITQTFDPNNPPNPYKIAWNGPWTDSGGNPLAAGDYQISITGMDANSAAVSQGPPTDPSNPPRVSLVEVSFVTFQQAGAPLDTDPAVGTLPNQQGLSPRPGGGVRIFAEAQQNPQQGGQVADTVYVTARTFPQLPANDPAASAVPVYFRSLDVADPNGPQVTTPASTAPFVDNRGAPQQGLLNPPNGVMSVPPGSNSAIVTLQVSHQPGDNFRVAASTSNSWVQGLTALPATDANGTLVNQIGQAVDGKGNRLAIDANSGVQISPVLTVWRTLHLEVDSMLTEPLDHAAAERNFIQGTITKIVATPKVPTQIVVEAEATSPSLTLYDGSPDLTGTGATLNLKTGQILTTGKGRFENGTICIGLGAASRTVGCVGPIQSPVDGSGGMAPQIAEYVQRAAGFQIPYELVDQNNSQPLFGNIVEWDSLSGEFTLDQPIGKPIYDGGTFWIGGIAFAVTKARGPHVFVGSTTELPFVLVDDDNTPMPIAIASSLLTAQDDRPSRNVLSQAYVRVSYDLPTDAKIPPFKRNVPYLSLELPLEKAQLLLGRDPTTVDSPQYWVGYFQAGFQQDETHDADPNMEVQGGVFDAETPGPKAAYGSLIYVEAIRDLSVNVDAQCGFAPFLSVVMAHELGHQFGLDEDITGIMTSACATQIANPFFTAPQLGEIRGR